MMQHLSSWFVGSNRSHELPAAPRGKITGLALGCEAVRQFVTPKGANPNHEPVRHVSSQQIPEPGWAP